MNTASKLSLTVVALLALGATAAQAQSANITATAMVQTALTVTNVQDLDFGAVFPGQGDQTIAPTDATSGRFSLAGALGAQINMTFSLPATLTGPGTPMAIGTWTGLQGNSATPVGAAFDPTSSPVVATLDATSGNWYVFLGATLTVPAVQTAGTYNGTITLDAVYTGN